MTARASAAPPTGSRTPTAHYVLVVAEASVQRYASCFELEHGVCQRLFNVRRRGVERERRVHRVVHVERHEPWGETPCKLAAASARIQ